MDNGGYLQYIGGTTGAIALTGVAAASALYLATRPKPENPLVPLDQQTVVIKETVDVSKSFFLPQHLFLVDFLSIFASLVTQHSLFKNICRRLMISAHMTLDDVNN